MDAMSPKYASALVAHVKLDAKEFVIIERGAQLKEVRS